jgi:hypothetical protein
LTYWPLTTSGGSADSEVLASVIVRFSLISAETALSDG